MNGLGSSNTRSGSGVNFRSLRMILILACAFLLCRELSNVQQFNNNNNNKNTFLELSDNHNKRLLPLTQNDDYTDRSTDHLESLLVVSTRNPAMMTTIATTAVNLDPSSSIRSTTTAAVLSHQGSEEPETMPHPSSTENTTTRGFAIAYVIGGCMPENPVYKNYFYDIAISVHLMRNEHSLADIIVFVQMSYQSKHNELPHQDVAMLHKLQIRVIYIPKVKNESFYRTMLDKFRILSLTEYNRVLFMDGDVMARGSLDYLYHLSMNGTLKENIVMAGKTEPANGGFFMLAPKHDSLERIMKIIKEKEIRGAALEYPHFDRTIGWGHAFINDYYLFIGSGRKMMEWKFHGDFADQGLLYQWVKYEEKSVSIIFKDTVENWVANASSSDDNSSSVVVVLENTLELSDILDHNPALKIPDRYCWKGVISPRPCRPPHNDYIHFTGTKKPWLKDPPLDFRTLPLESPQHFWFAVLNELNDSLGLGLQFDHWKKNQRPLLGLYPAHIHAAKTNFTF